MIPLLSYTDLSKDPCVLCFIAAYNGVIADYSLYENRVYVSDYVSVSEYTGKTYVQPGYKINFSRSHTSGLLVELSEPLPYGTFTVDVYVPTSPSCGMGVVSAVGDSSNCIQFVCKGFTSVSFCGKRVASTVMDGAGAHKIVTFFVAPNTLREYHDQPFFKVTVPDLTARQLKYVHIHCCWDVSSSSPSPQGNFGYQYSAYYCNGHSLVYFILYRGVLF